MTRVFCVVLVGWASATTLLCSPAFSQPAAEAPAANVAPVTVRAPRMAADAAARERACEAAMADPYARTLMEAGVTRFGGVRPPRTPDYNAPPLVLPDEPLPLVRSLREQGLAAPSSGTADLDPAADGADARAYGLAQAIAECRRGGARYPGSREAGGSVGAAASRRFWGGTLGAAGLGGDYTGGGSSGGFEAGLDRWANPASAIESMGRGQIRRNDTTLPMAFALFDQGRYELALEQFKAAHSKLRDVDGGDEAALMIGKIYLQGLREKSDPVQAVFWLKRAAGSYFNPSEDIASFNPKRPEDTTALGEAALILANIYSNGHEIIPKDPAQSRKYLERAVEVGHMPASKMLGDIYHQGVDTPKDLKKAFDHYMHAAKYAYAPAAAMVAQMYSAGEAPGGVDPSRALAWYNEAAKFDDPEGLYALAVAYDRGEGVAADAERALALYKIAAVNGEPAAQAAIGTYFYKGEILPHDPAIARQWFEFAALGGDADGMFNLAAMMAKGEGGEVDRVSAWGWLKIAEEQGHPNAAVGADALETDFTPEEHAGVAQLAPPTDAPAPAQEPEDPEAALVADLISRGVSRGPAWWSVSKGDAVVWVMGLPPTRTPTNLRWDASVLRQRLKGARVLIAPTPPWRSESVAERAKALPLPPPLAEKVGVALAKVGVHIRERPAAFGDAIQLRSAFQVRERLTDHAPSEIYLSARSRRVRVVAPPRRPWRAPASLSPGDPAVAACVEAILEDAARPADSSAAAARAWATGDVAAALAAAPPRLESACDVLWPGHWEQTVGFQTEAIAMALDMPGATVAVAHTGQLVAEDGILQRLRAMGYTVTTPAAPTTEQASR